VAEKNKTIVGIGGLIYHIGLVWIGYMSTIPHLQRQGIGQTLFRSLLERSRELDYQTIALFASKKGEPLYQKFGFTGLFYATRCSIEVDNPPNITMDIVQHSSIPEWIYRLDYEINGFDRRKFLDFIISLGSKVLILEDEGYCFITGSLIGPIIAQNTDQDREGGVIGVLYSPSR
ncbi:MAG: GNAT family N-acetyltransferase, partial [Candidatus Hodarchaeota archaeon]